MKNPLFTGVCTALVTPFLNGEVNYPMLERLIARQLEGGVHAIVLCGTTGEAPTLTDEEKRDIIARAKQVTGDDCLIIAGTGSNDTSHAVRLSRQAQEAGADAVLVVSPYYNKATPEGLCLHYQAVALSVQLPVIVYNVPSRTGVDIPVSVYRELSAMPNIAGVKEATGDMKKILSIRAQCPAHFRVWSGCDELTVPTLALGGAGVISVLSNLYPEMMQTMVSAGLDGDFDTAADLQIRFEPIIRALFSQPNPIPVKAAMKLLGFDCGEPRLPLTPASHQLVEKLGTLLNIV